VGINEYLFEKRYKTGLEKGIQQGAELERTKAIEEKHVEKLEMARNFKNLGVAITNIAKGTGLYVTEIQAL
jgi:predicted transposase YdaD